MNRSRVFSINILLFVLLMVIVSLNLQFIRPVEADNAELSHVSRQVIAPNAVPEGLTAVEWDSMLTTITETEYEVTWQTREGQSAYRAPNPAQGFSVAFAPTGFNASQRQTEERASWEFGLSLTHYGDTAMPPAVDQENLQVDQNHVTYQWHESVSEWYDNTPQGVKHGLTLWAPPSGDPGEITLTFVLRTSLTPHLVDGGQTLQLRDENGRIVLVYNQLVVYDAANQQLPSHMSLSPSSPIEPANQYNLIIHLLTNSHTYYPVTVDPWFYSQVAKLIANDAAANENFGWAVSISGSTALVGTIEDGDVDNYSGVAYIFERSQGGNDSWGQVAKLIANDAVAEDRFGYSLSLSGDIALVGAYGDDDAGGFSGSAYIFERNQGGPNNWGQVAKLTANDAAVSDHFGAAVSISGDMALVGAYRDDDGGHDSGSAYIFARNQGGANNWGQVAKLTADDAATDALFGESVSLSDNVALIGASGDDNGGEGSGAAYIFRRNQGGTNNWGQVAKLTASDAAAGDRFGTAVALSEDTALVGAYRNDDNGDDSGSAYIFERDQGGSDNWGQVAKLTANDADNLDEFGFAVSISDDTALVGAYGNDDSGNDSGSAYVFERNQGGVNNWEQVEKLTADDADSHDEFGFAVSLDGDTFLIGAHSDGEGALVFSGSAYIFYAQFNDPPIAIDDHYAVLENRTFNIAVPGVLANDIDADGDLLTASLLSTPSNGQVDLSSDGSFTYIPNPSFLGTDTFTYTVSDGFFTDTATVTITVITIENPIYLPIIFR
ncbi:MAG: cadherin-like domain-containing protein [Ardenticatenaceae bacterium]|nr:cadherin-like domain-containing protein [Ardenticatenaceae bacterium]